MAEYIDREAALEILCVCYPMGMEEDAYDRMHALIRNCRAANIREIEPGPTEDALELVLAERDRQKALWGDQSGRPLFEFMSILGEEFGELCEAVNETCFLNPKHPERGGRDAIIREAVQVAAVAVQIIEKMSREDGYT